MDMANTGVARGKIYLARNKRQPIPEGWAIDQDGAPTTDPQAAIDGIILPMAGYKGYAIAMMVDVLSGVLTGSGFLSQVHSPYKTAEKSNCGHFMIAINIEAFQPLKDFELPPKFRLPGGGGLNLTDWKEKTCSRYRNRNIRRSSRSWPSSE
jgi:LDH2 family malate/lactate/ureidoglycolate dehydrogenase